MTSQTSCGTFHGGLAPPVDHERWEAEKVQVWPVFSGFAAGNCYVVRGTGGFVLIDTARPSGMRRLEAALAEAGCVAGALNLIFLTHGDSDHTGNAARLRAVHGAPIAMHPGDAAAAETGDMFATRQHVSPVVRSLVKVLFRTERFSPDVLVDDGFDLSKYGIAAKVLSLPGHSPGSVGVLTEDRHLFCGDLLENTARPRLNTMLDDPGQARASFDRVRSMVTGNVYPGHGRPFAVSELE